MPDALILEFDGVGREEYEAVNEVLGIDMNTGTGAWPEGLLMHSAGATRDGGFVVYEVWDSVEAQERFMNERLGPALKQGGIEDPPSRAEWLDLHAHHSPGS
jgi:hypothetical protein